ncbi:MAG: hypothetical protein LBH77_03020 [Tannerella sp.]|jgi:hypothetical protein|nr:hypothetical protein [Tannerella sp.]
MICSAPASLVGDLQLVYYQSTTPLRKIRRGITAPCTNDPAAAPFFHTAYLYIILLAGPACVVICLPAFIDELQAAVTLFDRLITRRGEEMLRKPDVSFKEVCALEEQQSGNKHETKNRE